MIVVHPTLFYIVCCVTVAVVGAMIASAINDARRTARLKQRPQQPAVSDPQKSGPDREKDEKIQQVLANRAGREPAQVMAQIQKIEDEHKGRK